MTATSLPRTLATTTVALMSTEPRVSLANAIGALRAELAKAMAAGVGEDLRFRIADIELELSAELGREGGGNLGTNLWFVKVGADAKLQSANTQRILLRLKVEDRAGADPRINDDVLGEPR